MIELVLLDPRCTRIVAGLSPYVLAEGRAFVTAGQHELSFTFASLGDLRAFRDRLDDALASAIATAGYHQI